MTLWDCHSHLSFLSEQEVDEIIFRHPSRQWILGGYQPSEWESQVGIKKKNPGRIQTCYGLHPWYVKSDDFNLQKDIEALKIWSSQADWIGEVGLDFFGEARHLKKDLQTNVFEQQIGLAYNKPFVFHVVQAHESALEILNNYSVKGFVHSFSGSLQVAERYFQKGILLSFGPNILNENFKRGRQALIRLPIEAILIESDAPSHPADHEDPVRQLDKVYKEAARLRKIDVVTLQNHVAHNLETLIS